MFQIATILDVEPELVTVQIVDRDSETVELSCFVLVDGELVQLTEDELNAIFESPSSLSLAVGQFDPFDEVEFPFSFVCDEVIEPPTTSPSTCMECYDVGYEQGSMDCEPDTTGAVTSDPHVSGFQKQE